MAVAKSVLEQESRARLKSIARYCFQDKEATEQFVIRTIEDVETSIPGDSLLIEDQSRMNTTRRGGGRRIEGSRRSILCLIQS